MKYDDRRRFRPELTVTYLLKAFSKETEAIVNSQILNNISLGFLRKFLGINMKHHDLLELDLLYCYDLTPTQIEILKEYVDVRDRKEIDLEKYDYQLEGEIW